MKQKATKQFTIENAPLRFRNFSGKEGKFNAAGKRNFCVLLTKDKADELYAEGWPVKVLTPKTEDDDPIPYLQVNVKFGDIAPKIYLVTKHNKTLLTEDTVSALDYAEIESADIIIRPYNWEVNGNSGIKPYLKTAYITIKEDLLAEKYRDVPDSALAVSNIPTDDEDGYFMN